MNGQAVIHAHHDLWEVERSFRTTKSDPIAYPVFHDQHEVIEAHLTVRLATLAVASHLQDATDIAIKKLAQALRPLSSVVIVRGDQAILAGTTPGPEAFTILDQLLPNAPGHQTCESQAGGVPALVGCASNAKSAAGLARSWSCAGARWWGKRL